MLKLVFFYYFINMKEERDNFSILIVAALAVLNLAVWYQIMFLGPNAEPEVYFLDVGQGDATLTIFPGNVKMLTDAGYGFKVVAALENAVLGKYIDLAVVTHPQLDHFGGFNYLLDRYQFGAFIVTGRESEVAEWSALIEKVNSKGIPMIRLLAGDRISQGRNVVSLLSPTLAISQSGELNDTSFVSLVDFNKFKMLLTGDIGFSVENFLISNFLDLSAEVLKVGHHGSKYSTSEKFVNAVNPKVAVIEVGEDNRFGHPTDEVLERLKDVKIFRTDKNGTMKIVVSGEKLRVFTDKSFK